MQLRHAIHIPEKSDFSKRNIKKYEKYISKIDSISILFNYQEVTGWQTVMENVVDNIGNVGNHSYTHRLIV